jgi:hypothetical protein
MTDAIVVFIGSKQKIYTGAQLLNYGYAPVLYTTGNYPLSYYTNFLKEMGIENTKFLFDNEFSIYKNVNYALETAKVISKYKFESIRLVASADEIDRACIELEYYLPKDVMVIKHPVSRYKKDGFKTFIEYNKYLSVFLLSMLGKLDEFSIPYS